MSYKVIAEHPEYNETFSSYTAAYDWLQLVRVVFGSNAGIITVGTELA